MTKRTPFIAGNWKMNTTKASAIELAKAIAKGAPAGVEVGVAPAFRVSRCGRGDDLRIDVLLGRRMHISRRAVHSPAKFPSTCSRMSA